MNRVKALGSLEPGSVDFQVEAGKNMDIRKPVFFAMSRAGYPILMMKSVDLTLEDIFIQLTADETASHSVDGKVEV